MLGGLLLLLCARLAHAMDVPPHTAGLDILPFTEFVQSDAIESIEQLLELPSTTWQPLANGISFGYRQPKLWLRFTLESPTQQTLHLRVKPPYLDRVQLFQQHEDQWRSWQTGDHQPLSQRYGNARGSQLPLYLQPGSNAFWLLIETRSSLNASLELWQPDQLTRQLELENAFFYGLFGWVALGVLLSLFCSVWLRQAWYASAALYLLLTGLNQFYLAGFDQLYFYPEQPWHSDYLLGVVSYLGVSSLIGMLYQYLAIDRWAWGWRWWFRALLLAGLLGAAFSAFGYYPRLAPALMLLLMIVVVAVVVAALSAWRQTRQEALITLLAFGPTFVALALLVLRNLGGLPLNAWTSGFWEWATIWQIPVIMAAVLQRMSQQKRALDLQNVRQREQIQFFSLLSHELRTPLAVLSTAVQSLQLSSRTAASHDPERDQARLLRMQGALFRLRQLVDNSLGQQRLQQSLPSMNGQLQPIDHNAFASKIEQMMLPSAQHPLHIDSTALPGKLLADPDWLLLAVLNLLDNAQKYSPDGGAIDVRLCADGPWWLLSVSDSGLGVPEAARAQLFEAGFRAHQQQYPHLPGLGLGLYLVAQWAERSGGSLRHCPLSQGSRFELRLPLATD